MVELNLNHVNAEAPYSVWEQGGQYLFKTDHLIVYSVSFDEEEMLSRFSGYWLNLSNTSGLKSPNDKKISLTIAAIIKAFFESMPRVMLYLCDTADNQQSQRARLFFHWFQKYNKDNKFLIHTAIIKDEEEENYIALIAKRDNPQVADALAVFSDETTMFSENK